MRFANRPAKCGNFVVFGLSMLHLREIQSM
jgi:hypothetical protein